MGLPNLLNDVPRYDAVLPSNGEKVKFRPFLVKEQKVLMMAAETRDSKAMVKSMTDCVSGCVEGTDTTKLPSFDLDYIFIKIRSKSVGEKTDVRTGCSSCGAENILKIYLEKIEFTKSEISNMIDISNNISLKMKFPSYHDMVKNEKIFSNELTQAEILFETIILCIDSVITEEENIVLKDEPREQVEEFINSFNNEQLATMAEYIEALPKIKYTQKYECKSCKYENTFDIKGIQDFF